MRLRLSVFVLVLLSFSALSRGQAPTAVVNGQVRDPSGAAIAGATVEVFNDATHIRYATETNNEGIYSVPNLPPSTYHIQVSKQGFKTVVHPDITLNVQDAKAIGFTLPVGPISDTVTVEGGAPSIDTESAAVSMVVDRQFAENLPMNGRSFQTLIELTPGVVLTASNFQDAGQFSVNGQRAASNYWMVDGVSANLGIGTSVTAAPGNGLGGTIGSFSALGGTNSLVSIDAMQEFRIQTSTYAPEFGRTPGGQISIVTRSGTNQFHGTAFDYLRNDVLDANGWFADSKGLPKPEERQNDFGGTFSGPILKDKTFFFFSYEGLRLRLPQTTLTNVPCDSTCQVFGNARAMAAAAMQPFLNAFPLPNGAEQFNTVPCDPATDPACSPTTRTKQVPTGAAQFNKSYSNPATLDAYSLRVDHKLSTKWTLFGRYNYSPSEILQRGSGGFSLSNVSSTRVTTQTATVGLTGIISPAITNDLRFNYSRTNGNNTSFLDSFGGAVPLTSLPFPSPFTSQNSKLALTILSLGSGAGYQTGPVSRNLQRQINIVDSLSWQKGSHSLKFGVDFRRLSPLYNPSGYSQEPFFWSVPSAEKGTLLFDVIFSTLRTTFLFRDLGIYAQDTWRVLPRVTLTYGVRWDLDFVPRSLDGPSFPALTGFDLANLSKLALAPAGTAPYKTTYGNFAPRIGLAYQLRQNADWQTVFRGGFGVFYDLATSEAGNSISIAAFPFGGHAVASGTFPLSPSMTPTATITPAGGIFGFDPHLSLPYTLEWNASLEQAIGKQQTFSVSYIGASGRRLIQSAFVNSPNLTFASVGLVTNAGTSSYNALQLQYQRRLSHGLQALASYTFSHSIDTASAGSTFNVPNALVPGIDPNANRGPSDFDIRNTFTAGATYDVPAPRINAFANAILSGWSLESFVLARSAPPVYISDALFVTQINNATASIRPDLVPGQALYLYGPNFPGGKAFNPAAFTDPPFDPSTGIPVRQGNVPRNFLRGFAATEWDFAVHREFPIHELLKLQFRAEMFNVLNHPNFGPPSGAFLNPAFGLGTAGFGLATQLLGQSLGGGNVGSGGLNPLYQVGGPRSIQFALKLQF